MCPNCYFFFQAEDGIRDGHVTGVQTCALPIFSEYVKENYTSRSGFISYHSNEVDEWFDYIIDYDNLDDDLHKLGAILDFICQHVLEMDESWVHENVTYVHIGGYYDIDKLIKKLNSTL